MRYETYYGDGKGVIDRYQRDGIWDTHGNLYVHQEIRHTGWKAGNLGMRLEIVIRHHGMYIYQDIKHKIQRIRQFKKMIRMNENFQSLSNQIN